MSRFTCVSNVFSGCSRGREGTWSVIEDAAVRASSSALLPSTRFTSPTSERTRVGISVPVIPVEISTMGAILNDGRDPKSPHELSHMPTPETLLRRRSSKSSSPEDEPDAAVGSGAVSASSRRHQHHAGDYRLPYAPEFFRSYPHLREFFCGGTAAAINIVITFPPNKIMFRQQLFGLNTWDAYQNVKSEGISMLYRGVKPPLLQAAVSKSIMFGLYNWYDEALVERFGNRTGIHLLAAGLSGSTEAILTPFERAQTLLQTPKFNGEITGAYDAIVHLNKFGLREHYRGLTAILFRNGPGNMLFFGLREPLRNSFPVGESSATRMLNDFICGALLGAVISTVSFPINVARTRMQSVYGEPFIGTVQALRLTYAERGHSLSKLYRGVHVNFFRSLLSWGIINSAYEKLKSMT